MEGAPKTREKAAKANTILFLDDNPERHLVFDEMCPGALHVWTSSECKKALLDNPPFDCAFLDHDLGGKQMVKTIPGTGTEVAEFIRDHLPKNKYPKQVVVHSWNPVGASRMSAAIAEAGIPVKKVPFGE